MQNLFAPSLFEGVIGLFTMVLFATVHIDSVAESVNHVESNQGSLYPHW